MDTDKIAEELRRLEALVAGWSAQEKIPELERDLALEKLRGIYDAVRFPQEAAPAADAADEGATEAAAQIPVHLDLDLDRMLDAVPLADAGGGVGPAVEPEWEPEPEVVTLPEPELMSEPMAVPELVPTAAEPATVPGSVREAATEAGGEASKAEIPVGTTAAGTVPEFAPKPTEAEPATVPEHNEAVPDVPRKAEAAPAPDAPQTGSAAAPEVSAASAAPEAREMHRTEHVSQTLDVPKASEAKPDIPQPGKPTVIEPALFGMDEIVQHKRKQRVIMSLYDDRPDPVRASVATPKEGPAAQPAAEPLAAGAVSMTERQTVPEKPSAGDADRSDRVAATRSEAAPARHTAPEPSAIASAPEPNPAVKSGGDDSVSNPASAAGKSPAETKGAHADAPAGAVLGEVINRDVQTLAESLAPPRDAVSDAAHRAPVADLREAIGINDKFLLIRDLFDGDAEACDRAIDALNAFTDLDDCMIHIAEHYAWNPNSDGARLLMELLERKMA